MRIRRLLESMEKADLGAYIVTREPNIYYFTGSISGGVLLAVPDDRPLLLAPRVNFQIAYDDAQGCEVKQYSRTDLIELILESLGKRPLNKIGFDDLSLDLHRKLGEKLSTAELKHDADLIWEMRRIKDAGERDLMRRAAELTVKGMNAVRECLREGIREYEVAAEATYAMMADGAEESAFPIIVASGPRSTYPHAYATDRKIMNGDLVTVDMGATYKGYRSDLTRTFIVGEPSQKQTEIYEAVLCANEAAFPEIREGAKGRDIDSIARSVVKEAGYGERFVHSLGHGIGLEVHEPPTLSETSEDVLVEGNVVSNEPGIYIPGFGGVRIEDSVLVTGSGPERLTRFERGLGSMIV